ncbi:MAG: diacylglycerol kinase family lipid kinase [Bacteroidales bacterium]|nr:MAG: diacylglycerol kinase family lipid kinase [Bacteroidales bacterium]
MKRNIMSANDSDTSWLVLVNPNAGSGRGKRDWKLIDNLLKTGGFRYQTVFTEKKYHAIDLAARNIERGYKKIIVVGGDGTLNEVMNGAFLQKKFSPKEVLIGMIPVGTGNDWERMYNIPSDYSKAINVLKRQRTFTQDAGIIHYHESGSRKIRYFINIAGMGFDARVVQKTNRQKDEGKKGALLYFLNIFTSLINYKCTHISIEIDGEHVYDGTVFSLSLGIGKFCGGGMRQTPEAIPDDGLFDLTIIKEMPKVQIIMSLKRLFDGSILHHPRVAGFTGKRIRIDSEPPIYIEADGESLGQSPVEFEIIPGSLDVIIGDI